MARVQSGGERNTVKIMSTIYNRRQLLWVAATATTLQTALPQSQKSQSQKKMRLGVVTGMSADPERAIKQVHDLGFPTCQLVIEAFDDATVVKLRDALAKYKVE